MARQAGADPGPGAAAPAAPASHDAILRNRARLAALTRTALLDASPSPSLDRFTRLASQLTRAPVSLLSLVDSDRQFFASAHGLAEPWASRRQTPLSHSFCQYVVSGESPLVVPDATKDALVAGNLAIPELGVAAYAGVPLRTSDGAVIGAFCVIDEAPHAWTDADVAILEDLAAAVLTEVELRSSLSRWETLLAGVPAVVFDLGSQSLEPVFIEGQVEELVGHTASELLAKPELWEQVIDPRDRGEVLAVRARARDAESPSTIAFRVRHPDGEVRWMQESVSRKVDSSGNCVAIHGAMVDITPQRLVAQRLAAQNAVSLVLASAEDVDDALRDVVREVGSHLEWEVGAVWLVGEDDRLRPRATWNGRDADSALIASTATLSFRRGEGLPGRTWAASAPVWLEDYQDDDAAPRAAAARADGVHAAFAFPIFRKGTVAGVVEFFARATRGADDEMIRVASAIGSQVGDFLDRRAFEEALRAQQEHYAQVARTFQRSLVPDTAPAIPGCEVALRFRPATDDALVGGDFIDAFRIDATTWGLSIGDVCGKGAEAAAIASLVRHAMRTAALDRSSPAGVLELANRVIETAGVGERFCTALFATLQGDDGAYRLTLASAGHPPALVFTENEVRSLGSTGLPLGLLDDIGGGEVSVTLHPGDAVVMCTDGFLEARNDDDMFGESRLRDIVAATGAAGAVALADAITGAVDDFASGVRRDDSALLIVRTDDLG